MAMKTVRHPTTASESLLSTLEPSSKVSQGKVPKKSLTGLQDEQD